MLAESGLLNDKGNLTFSAAGQPMCIYGDPAYPLWIHLQVPYRQGHLPQQIEDYNKAMDPTDPTDLLNHDICWNSFIL